jgi:BlaI family penicillinase repressor
MKSISDSEREVMKVLWAESPLSLSEIVERVQRKSTWSVKTIQTFVNRLRQKGALVANRGEVYTYVPAVSMEETRVSEVQRVVEKFYGSSVNQFITSFIGNAKLSEKDLEELTAYLSDLKNRR